VANEGPVDEECILKTWAWIREHAVEPDSGEIEIIPFYYPVPAEDHSIEIWWQDYNARSPNIRIYGAVCIRFCFRESEPKLC
jgi:hypothetical protein